MLNQIDNTIFYLFTSTAMYSGSEGGRYGLFRCDACKSL